MVQLFWMLSHVTPLLYSCVTSWCVIWDNLIDSYQSVSSPVKNDSEVYLLDVL